MSETKIEKLTPEQEALIPVYREKWRRSALSTERIDRQKAAEAVKAIYAEIGKKEPEILFFDSPYAVVLTAISSQLWSQLWSQVKDQQWSPYPIWIQSPLERQMECQVWRQLERQLESQLLSQLEESQLESQLESQQEIQLKSQLLGQLLGQLLNQLESQLESQLGSRQLSELGSHLLSQQAIEQWGLLSDFCISVLNCAHNQRKWSEFKWLLKDCGWIFTFGETYLICDRPTKLFLDDRNRLHAEGKPAIEFADGWSLYSYHGVTLPEKYGKLHPNEWQAQWVLEENNAELRRILIQGIGYDRIIQELEATELDSWREYTLLKIDIFDDYDEENQQDLPIYLLKMTCPSTGFIHALRVPPEMKSAREAISWVNWGIDPEEFAVQT